MATKELILFYIFKLQALTNDHLCRLIYSSEDDNSNKLRAKISKQIVTLRNEGLITSDVWLPYGGKIHSLTQEGINFINNNFDINPRHPYSGFDKVQGNFKESVLRLKESDLSKHMIFVEFAIKVINAEYFVRNKFYCVKHYQTIENNVSIAKKIQPYGEFTSKLGNKPYVLEIISSNEEKSELIEKFKGYHDYFNYLSEQGKPILISGIYILTDVQQNIPYHGDSVWQTIINAALEGLGPYSLTIEFTGLNKPSLKELYNKSLLKHDNMLHQKQNEEIEKTAQDPSSVGADQSLLSEGRDLEDEEKDDTNNKAESGKVYTSKYASWIEDMLTRDARWAKEELERQERAFEEQRAQKGVINRLKRLFSFK
ncbi:hypothetical protein [Metabacillus malikii]|uniref:Uncharacterized protein n=1 Tax=Metabacillus malikii TaxID=1504265 RepID=A0ABT9ZGC8_9BACI|nr:hypothetical protein [Metabacillus malikii]MDQ0230944.1 hypothetical protein [Metabacillus malikii]